MALTSETYIDKLEILEDGQIQVREAKVIYEDGKEVASSFHRYVLDPGRDDDAKVQEKTAGRTGVDVRAVAQAVWTPEKVAERKAFMETQRTRDGR